MAAFPGVGSWIERRARLAPHHVALAHGNRRWTYAELADRIAKLASGLTTLGVTRGDRVAWLGDNHPSFLETFFAVAQLGAVFAPVNHRLPRAVVADLLGDYKVRVVIVADSAAALDLPAHVAVVHICGGASAVSYEGLIASASPAGSEPRVDADDVCMMPHTSGTTGAPKGVMLTHSNVTWNVINMLSVADFRSDDVTLALAPLFRTGGVGVNVLPLLFKGGTVVLPVATTPAEVLEAIERDRITVGFGNPDLLDALTRCPRWASADLSSIRFFITGGGPVPARLIRAYGERDVTFLQGYGLSEASPVVSVLDAANVVRKSGSAGRTVPFVDARAARPDGSDCGTGETGELLVNGPTIMAGYWNRPDATLQAIDEFGWLRTGDAARIDDEGFVWIVDRVANAFTHNGQIVYPGDVERCIGEHPAARDVGVVGVDGSGHAFVVLHDQSTATATEIIEHCTTRLGESAAPSSVVFVDALPRTSVGKLDRLTLVERTHVARAADSRRRGSWNEKRSVRCSAPHG